MEAHFEHFWSQLAKWLAGGIWRPILSISRAVGQTALKGVLEAQVDQLLDEFHPTVFLKVEFPHDVKFGNGVVSRSGALCSSVFLKMAFFHYVKFGNRAFHKFHEYACSERSGLKIACPL